MYNVHKSKSYFGWIIYWVPHPDPDLRPTAYTAQIHFDTVCLVPHTPIMCVLQVPMLRVLVLLYQSHLNGTRFKELVFRCLSFLDGFENKALHNPSYYMKHSPNF